MSFTKFDLPKLKQFSIFIVNYACKSKEIWNKPLSIIFEVGDNIKDFSQTTQENVDTKDFIERISSDVLLLPNAVYGSWE